MLVVIPDHIGASPATEFVPELHNAVISALELAVSKGTTSAIPERPCYWLLCSVTEHSFDLHVPPRLVWLNEKDLLVAIPDHIGGSPATELVPDPHTAVVSEPSATPAALRDN